jgi:hypothetical protein
MPPKVASLIRKEIPVRPGKDLWFLGESFHKVYLLDPPMGSIEAHQAAAKTSSVV